MSVDRDDGASRILVLEAELAALRADMQHFAYAVSHDLRAPLRHIVSYAQLVQEDAGEQLSDEVQGFLRTMTDSAQHMGAQLDGLATWARVSTVVVEPQFVDLHDLVLALQQAPACQGGLGVQWELASDLPTVWADPTLLRQALEHVLSNAVKFSAGQAAARILIAPWHDRNQGLTGLCVQDHGAGYNPAQQACLFKVFGRLHSTQQFPGIGMGLATARRIMERLGGQVAITSPGVGRGALVTVGLPARYSDPEIFSPA